AGDEIVSVKFLSPSKPNAAESDNDQPPLSRTIPFGNKLSWPGFALEGLIFLDPQTKFQFEIKRGDKTHTVELATVELKDDKGRVVHSSHRGLTFDAVLVIHKADSFAEAIRLGAQETIDNLLLVYRFLQKIGQRQVPLTGIGGPVTIAEQAG